MCTLVISRQPGESPWTILIAANRDEMAQRASLPPARHWQDRPETVAGLDQQAGGSWLGINDFGVMAAILNRRGSLGPMTGKRSRGELVLDALDHADAQAAADALIALNPEAYRPFNLVIADNQHAFWLRHADTGQIETTAIPPGLSMITAGELNDMSSARIRRYRPIFEQAGRPRPEAGDWSDWQLLLASTSSETGEPMDAMCIETAGGYGTRSSSLIGLPKETHREPVWLYADGPPGTAEFQTVEF